MSKKQLFKQLSKAIEKYEKEDWPIGVELHFDGANHYVWNGERFDKVPDPAREIKIEEPLDDGLTFTKRIR